MTIESDELIYHGKLFIKQVKISNFKSFKSLRLHLGKFNVLIGANASGKSNFIQLFKFLSDISNHGLDNAISLQGGVEYLRNFSIGTSENLVCEIVFDVNAPSMFTLASSNVAVIVREVLYRFSLKFTKRRNEYYVVEDTSTYICDISPPGKEKIRGHIVVFNDRGKLGYKLNIPKNMLDEDSVFPPFLKGRKLEPKSLLLQMRIFYPMPIVLHKNIGLYDFETKLSRKAIPFAGKGELECDGSNLPIVLKKITKRKGSLRKFFDLVKDILPFIKDIKLEPTAGKYLSFSIKETYRPNVYVPSSLTSEGTINVILVIIALYFEDNYLVLIEEPERNIHPHLISRVVSMMKDVSENKQIIVSTHNPEVVKHAGLENILLVSRDAEGFSEIIKPLERQQVVTFLKNDLGIEELYVQNLLDA